MNWLLIVVIGLLIWNVIDGYRKGFLRVVFSLISWVLVLIFCNIATPMVTEYLVEETQLSETITLGIEEKIKEAIMESGMGNVDFEIPEEFQTMLPEDIQTMIPEELWQLLGGEAEQGGLLMDVSSIVHTVISVIAFILVLIVARIALMVIELILGIASKLPLIGSADKLLGIICGGAKGLFLSWLLLAGVSILVVTGVNTELAANISASPLLMWLQENNFILDFIVIGQ